ncbi:MAG TPA: hypothetical protein VN523_03495 [Hyphomicrobiaceae bacterium]|jgi:hypothetical protein|nr:hypothetical protein [Hyphomicrobiaceae bacterium]
MAAPRRRKQPRRPARTRSTPLAAAPGPALRGDLTPAAPAGADLFELMGNMAARCAELPLRLLRARSPLEVWQEQMLFIQSVTNAYRLAARLSTPPALRANRTASKSPAKRSKAKTRTRKLPRKG